MNQNNIPALSSAGKNTGDSDDNYLYIKDPLWYIPQRITIYTITLSAYYLQIPPRSTMPPNLSSIKPPTAEPTFPPTSLPSPGMRL